MGEGLRYFLLFAVFVFCCIYPYSYNERYTDKYGSTGLSYPIAIISGASGVWFSLVYENKESTAYAFALILLVISILLNICKIKTEFSKAGIDVADKFQLSICQVLFAVGIFGVLIILLGIVYLASGGGKRKKRK